MSKFEALFANKVVELEDEARRLGVTQEALAAAAGVASCTIRRWKRRLPATVQTFGKLERALEAKRASIRA